MKSQSKKIINSYGQITIDYFNRSKKLYGQNDLLPCDCAFGISFLGNFSSLCAVL